MRSIGPAVTREQSPAFLRNSNGRLDFPGPTQEAILINKSQHMLFVNLKKNLKSSEERNPKEVGDLLEA